MRIIYVNGAYTPEDQAQISVFDRGFLFGDGVYEVSSVLEGALIDNAAHLARLRRSLEALSIPSPATNEEITNIQFELIARNKLQEGVVYLQVTRGAAERSFDWPQEPKPSLVMFTQKKSIIEAPAAQKGASVAIVPDLRWRRRDIKTIALLPASWAKEQARAAGAQEAWMAEAGPDGRLFITEGSSNNAYIVTKDGVIVTRQLGDHILSGITRAVVLSLAEKEGLQIEERPFTPQEAYAAEEAFVTSASTFVTPVVSIDGREIGAGVPGRIARMLRALYIETARQNAQRP